MRAASLAYLSHSQHSILHHTVPQQGRSLAPWPDDMVATPPPLPTATYRDTVLKVGLLCCSYGEMRVLTGLDLRGGLGVIMHGKHSEQQRTRSFFKRRFFMLCLLLTSEIHSTASGVAAVTADHFTPGPGVWVLGHSAVTQPNRAELWTVLLCWLQDVLRDWEETNQKVAA